MSNVRSIFSFVLELVSVRGVAPQVQVADNLLIPGPAKQSLSALCSSEEP